MDENIELIEVKIQENEEVDKCRCCLQENGQRIELWAEYYCDGEKENYGEMLSECFSLGWCEPKGNTEFICLECIESLRNAYNFRKKLITSNMILQPHENYVAYEPVGSPTRFKKEDDPTFSTETENVVDYAEPMEDLFEELEDGEEEYVPTVESDTDDEETKREEYLEVEFLDEESNEADAEGKKTRHRVKGKTPYKNYDRKTIEEALEAVRSKAISVSKAAAHYKVPGKTIAAKLRAMAKKPNNSDEENKSENSVRLQKFATEVKILLSFTSAMVYKTNKGRLYCAYCSTKSQFFDEPDELRSHTMTAHQDERISGIDAVLKPFWLNETVKVDIVDLECSECNVKIEGWNDMFVHLAEEHEVQLDEAYTKVIPYKLENDLRCALCMEKFRNYHVLDSHMNAHYSNYICGDCGDTFLSESRLKKHMEIHNVGKFPCRFCNKNFGLEKYRKKHEENVHKNNNLKFRCNYCPDRFSGEYARHSHMLQEHPEKVKTLTCEYCPKTFNWRPYYLKHLRMYHQKKEKKYQCALCDKMFMMRYELKKHEEWHRDPSMICGVCDKKFSTKQYLQKHMKRHEEQ